jgi:ATP-dependent Clp protease ATP-binding subunit ClpA
VSIKKIVAKFINEVNELLSEKSIKIRLTETAVEHLVEVGYDSKMGARPLGRKISDLIKVPLSKKILFENIPANTVIEVDWTEEKFEFTAVDTFTANIPTVDENGYIVLDSVQS